MKVIPFIVSLVLFVGSFLMFAYAFAVDDAFRALLFGGGILAVSLSLAIPFHLLERIE